MRKHIIAAAALALLSGACAHPGEAQAPPAAAPAAGEQRFGAAALRADFLTLYERLKSAHVNLNGRVSRRDYDRLHSAMLAEIDHPETRPEAARRFQRFVAFGRVAHARIDENYRSWSAYLAAGGRSFPLTLRLRDGRAFVTGLARDRGSISIGDEVVAIQGRSIRDWLKRGHRHVSADTEYMMGALLELDLPMLLWLELGPVDRYEVALRREGSGPRHSSLPARTRDEIRAASAGEPPRLDLAAADRTARLLPGNVAYLRPGAFYNSEAGASDPYDNRAFRAFIDQSFERFLAAGARTLIVDLRDNPGGDSSFSDLMVSWFADRPFRFASAFRIKVSPETIESNRKRLETSDSGAEGVSARFARLYAGARPGELVDFPIAETPPRPGPRFEGEVYALTNRNSYSNAVAVAATIQDYGFGRIIGEETSDLATTYGAMETFTLPLTGLQVGYPKAHIIRPNGSLEPRGVVPDVAIETPLFEGRDDPVLMRALELVSGSGAKAGSR